MIGRPTIIWITLLTIMLSGCWDQRLLKEHSLILGIGYDRESDGTIIKTVSFPPETSGGGQQPMPAENSKVLTTNGNTVKDAENKLSQLIPEKFDRSKARVILIGDELAKDGILATLDSVYRDLRGPLIASIAVVKGTAEDASKIKVSHSRLVSDFYSDLLNNAEESGIIMSHTVQSIRPTLLSVGEDIVLPYIHLKQKKNIAELGGSALFYKDKMTGTLDLKETIMFLILSKQTTRRTMLSIQVSNDKKKHVKNYADIAIHEVKRKFKVQVDEQNKVKAKLNLTLEVEVDEYSPNNLGDEARAKTLAKKIENELNKMAKTTIDKILKANSDALGIGERVKAYNHNAWKNINWDKAYPETDIETTFDVDIIRHGIVD